MNFSNLISGGNNINKIGETGYFFSEQLEGRTFIWETRAYYLERVSIELLKTKSRLKWTKSSVTLTYTHTHLDRF